jgi:(p)ppGpp synthase/HD superfamily hydrolase
MEMDEYEGSYHKAVTLVQHLFKDKKDRAGRPYIEHLIYVSDKLKTDVLRTVGLLHDLFEDIDGWDYNKLNVEFGFPSRICDLVQILTRDPYEDYSAYIQRISTDNEAILVKLADLEHNMQLTRLTKELTEKDIERLKKYHKSYLFLKNKLSEWYGEKS